ncbi:PDDEXK nuclease domain-containing protein [Algoriphagus sp. AGSA1]|uniref:PDDEXK nuclease domain-containing protein n=1 Tax=Algoriphagus sp. AGSA1 TaxID=2907213 RepID=UPI001F174B1C|nr:PDDEXK nuclease domain-containing protein [Algoriphagus sp. AGSA1]MCE7057995.1 PDDEXK nuclease domain-containing protein [Algoriphagus sp. AGSA1]
MKAQDTNLLLKDLASIIENGKSQIAAQVNSTLTLVYWQIGHRINTHILENQRAEYGKEIIPKIASQLANAYGKSFQEKNLRRMIQFAEIFPDFQIVAPLARQLSWSHFTILIPIKNHQARMFYCLQSAESNWSKRELRNQIERKAFERKEIAQIQLSETDSEIQSTFKDPYFLDFLGLKEGYLENDIEGAILTELEHFILELGKGFAFVERQKRIILDGVDFYIDLLFFHRKLKRLVAVELKLNKFKPAYKGQMELYLKWLNKYEKQEGENPPIGLILCAEKSNEQIELLEMGKDGIIVSEYWTELPAKSELEAKLHQALIEAKARIEQKKLV